jgi:hypothetical protein
LPANVRVRPGDLLGLQAVSFSPCAFKDPAGEFATFSGDLPDGAAADFGPDTGISVSPKITYTPTGGDPSTQSRKLTLKKER